MLSQLIMIRRRGMLERKAAIPGHNARVLCLASFGPTELVLSGASKLFLMQIKSSIKLSNCLLIDFCKFHILVEAQTFSHAVLVHKWGEGPSSNHKPRSTMGGHRRQNSRKRKANGNKKLHFTIPAQVWAAYDKYRAIIT